LVRGERAWRLGSLWSVRNFRYPIMKFQIETIQTNTNTTAITTFFIYVP
jgi:hypothetical protein